MVGQLCDYGLGELDRLRTTHHHLYCVDVRLVSSGCRSRQPLCCADVSRSCALERRVALRVHRDE